MSDKYLRNSKGSLAEFAPAFGILILALFPLLDLLGLAMSVGTAQFIGSQAVQKAAVANSPSEAVDAMYQELDTMANSNFAKFANLSIDGAIVRPNLAPGMFFYASPNSRDFSTTKLYVVRTNIQTQVTEHASAPPPDQFDPNTYIYEYYGVTNFRIQPYINLSGIPGLNSIPGLGQPFTIKFAATRAVESTDQFDTFKSPVNRPTWGANGMAGAIAPSPWQQGLPR